ncbi:MAG: hypothetical protein JSV30_06210 [Candidatus Omnitrophota bacterium]|nr:MAG: hypothetical protein JSV30_06210 [Candidatus Omnitrophota bacterium]
MYQGNVFINWQYFRKDKKSGQVATLITLAIAIIFLFVAVTLNISRVAEKKTATANAADAAAMKLASYLGSYANTLSWHAVDGKTFNETRHYTPAWKIVTVVTLTIVAVIASGGTALAAALGGTSTALAAGIGAGITGLGYAYDQFIGLPEFEEELQKELKKLELEDNLSEQAIKYALENCVDDPVMVIDVHDYNKDDDVTDEIPRFYKWYMERVKMLSKAAAGKRAQIDSFVGRIETFARDDDSFSRRISGEFIPLFEELEAIELDLSFWEAGPTDPEESLCGWDEVDDLKLHLDNFYQWALGEDGLCVQDFDSIVMLYNSWMLDLLRDEEEPWYDVWEEDIVKIENWCRELYDVYAQLEGMIAKETDAEQKASLLELQERLAPTIGAFVKMRDKLRGFNNEVLVFDLQSKDENFASENEATYSWYDSLGWHHVRVEVSAFTMPWVKPDTDRHVHRTDFEVWLKNYRGTVTVTVTRYDESNSASFAREGTPLWKFRYVKDAQAEQKIKPEDPESALPYGIKSEATASYTFNELPKLVDVK